MVVFAFRSARPILSSTDRSPPLSPEEVDEYEDDMDAINVGEKIHRRPE